MFNGLTPAGPGPCIALPRPDRNMRFVFGFLAFVLLLGHVPLRAQDGPATPGPVLQPGDRVNLEVYRNRELSGTFLVAQDGTLLHPLFGEVQVAGLPMATVRQRVDQYLRRYEADPRFVVAPEYRVFVGGFVRDQNQFYLPEISIAQAIVRAGGSTAPNRRYRVRLIRGGQHTLVGLTDPNVAEFLQQPIRSGDQIVVEERPSFSRSYLDPALRVLQTVGSILSTYVILTTVLDSGDDDGGGTN